MQWNAGVNAGFCPPEADPWLPLAEDYETNNVEAQRENPRSMLVLHRRLLALRRTEPALSSGSYSPVEVAGDLLAYEREQSGRRFLIVLNLGRGAASLPTEGHEAGGRVVLSTHLDRDGEDVAAGAFALRGDEGAIIELRSNSEGTGHA